MNIKNLKQIIKDIVNECISDRKSVIENQGITSVPHDYDGDNKRMKEMEAKLTNESVIDQKEIVKYLQFIVDNTRDYQKIAGDEAVFRLGKIHEILKNVLIKINN